MSGPTNTALANGSRGGDQPLETLPGLLGTALSQPEVSHLRSFPLCLPTVQVMPYANQADRRRFEAARAAKRRAAGLCANCNAPALPGQTRCQAHLRRKAGGSNGVSNGVTEDAKWRGLRSIRASFGTKK